MPLNIEIKAYCKDPDRVKERLLARQAKFIGLDHQIDTYFKASEGRLKLREGTIEHSLIHYQRSNQEGPKQSKVLLYHPQPDPQLKAVLAAAMGILIVVDKQRSIFFIDNIKFHIDQVKELGSFVEIEAIDKDGQISEAELLRQCQEYMEYLAIQEQDLLAVSYSDLLLQLKKGSA